MAITLVTGAPGAGKTLWTLQEVEKLRRETGRQVLYNGISGVTLSEWKPVSNAELKATIDVAVEGEEGKHVHDLPPGSIVVVDECYRVWPQGGPGELPRDVEAFAVHRHRGLDFFLLVQRVHHFVRGLVARHVHFERQFGLDRSRRFEWQKLGDPKDRWSKQEAAGSEFLFPKEVYSWYKSADLHTVKKRLPWKRLALIPGLVLVIVALLWSAVSILTSGAAELGPQASSSASSPAPAHAPAPDPRLERVSWSAQWVERVPGQPHSAPFYDPTVRPAAMPKISGCMEIRSEQLNRCVCNTQQGTAITSLTLAECRFYLANGWFDPTRPDEDEDREEDQGDHMTASGSGAPQLTDVFGGQAAAGASGAAPPPPGRAGL